MQQHQTHWYAAKVFFNRIAPVEDKLKQDEIKYFTPSEHIPSLIFIQSTELYIKHLQETYSDRLWIYTYPHCKTPHSIPDREMEIFIFVCTAGQQGLTFLGDDKPDYHMGEKVRVIDGPFKGAEGHIKRIKKDRRLIVSIQGIAAVATAFIPFCYLEKCDE